MQDAEDALMLLGTLFHRAAYAGTLPSSRLATATVASETDEIEAQRALAMPTPRPARPIAWLTRSLSVNKDDLAGRS